MMLPMCSVMGPWGSATRRGNGILETAQLLLAPSSPIEGSNSHRPTATDHRGATWRGESRVRSMAPQLLTMDGAISRGGRRLLDVGVRGRWSGRAKPVLSWENLGHQLPPHPRGAPGCIPPPGVLPGGCLAVLAPCRALGHPGTRHPEVLDAGHPAGRWPGPAELGAPRGPGASPAPRRDPRRDAASPHTPSGSLPAPPRAG